MGNNDYLIPANSKRSMLILGMFNSTDVLLVGTGFTITLITRNCINNNANVILCIPSNTTSKPTQC